MDLSWLEFSLLRRGDYALTVGDIVIALLILVLSFRFSSWGRRAITRVMRNPDNSNAAQIYAINRLVHYVLVLVGVLFAVSSLGVGIDNLLLVAGALGVGIGFGLQHIANNFVSGIVIMLEKSIKVGDLIELESGIFGEVIELNIRATLIRTNDNVDILVPNSEFIAGRVTNWTMTDAVRRFRIPFSVAYGSNKRDVKRAVLEAADAVAFTLKAPGRGPTVWMSGFGDSSLEFTLGVWVTADAVKTPTLVTSEYLWAIDDALRKYNIEIPFPQRDLHLRSAAGWPSSAEPVSPKSQSSNTE